MPAIPRTPEEAANFIEWCCRVLGQGFHPDTPAAEYITGDGKTVFTNKEAIYFEHAMNACFRLLPDPYKTALNFITN